MHKHDPQSLELQKLISAGLEVDVLLTNVVECYLILPELKKTVDALPCDPEVLEKHSGNDKLTAIYNELKSILPSYAGELAIISKELPNLLPTLQQSAALLNDGVTRNTENPAYVVETPLNEVIAKLAKFLQLSITAKQVKLAQHLKAIYDYYTQALSTWQNAKNNDAKRRELLIPRAQLAGSSLDNFYYTSQQDAREILCRDLHGLTEKTNGDGNHPVRARKGGHFKPNPEAHDFVNPGYEDTNWRLTYSIVPGSNFNAPTMLVKLSSVYFEKVNDNEAEQPDKEAFKEYKRLIVTGKSKNAEELFVNNPDLKSKLNINVQYVGRVVQVGQTIGYKNKAISLMQLASLVKEFQWLQRALGDDLKLELSDIIKGKYVESKYVEGKYVEGYVEGKYVENFFKNHPQFSSNLNDEDLLDQILLYLGKYTPAIRLRIHEDMQDSDYANIIDLVKQGDPKKIYRTDVRYSQKLLHRFRQLKVTFGIAYLVQVLALIDTYPQLRQQRMLSEMAAFLKLLKVIRVLFPKESPEEIIKAVPRLYDKIDDENYSSLFLDSIPKAPSDGKFDNYMVEIIREGASDDSPIERLNIWVIDGDKLLADEFIRLKEHFPGIKCALYCMPNRNRKISKKKVQEFLARTPEEMIISALSDLYQQQLRYQRLKVVGILDKSDFVDSSNHMPSLDIPLKFVPEKLSEIYNILVAMHHTLRVNEALGLTHMELLDAIRPVLSDYYRRVNEESDSSIDALFTIYRSARSAEKILADKLDVATVHGTQTFRTYLQNQKARSGDSEENRTQPLEEAGVEVIKRFIYLAGNFGDKATVDNKNYTFKLLRLIGEHLPFVNSLPVAQELVKQIHFKIKVVESGYDLCLMLEPKYEREPGKLYINSTTAGLEYEVIGLDNNLKKATISWDNLPKFPRDSSEIIKSKNEFLPTLLEITSYDLCLMLEPKYEREPGKLYINSTIAGLEYELLGLDNKLKKAIISWKDLPKFPRDSLEIIKLKNKFLPTLLEITSKAGYTLLSNIEAIDKKLSEPQKPDSKEARKKVKEERAKLATDRKTLISKLQQLKVEQVNVQAKRLNELLMTAVSNKDIHVIAAILRAGGDPNCSDDSGRTPLHLIIEQHKKAQATLEQTLAVIDVLMTTKNLNPMFAHREPINPNLYDSGGYAAIHLTTDLAIIEKLVIRGADPEVRIIGGKEGGTLLDKVVRKRDPKLFVELVERGFGYKANGQLVLNFINSFSKDELWRSKMANALATLLTQNDEIIAISSKEACMIRLSELSNEDFNAEAAANPDQIYFEGYRTGKGKFRLTVMHEGRETKTADLLFDAKGNPIRKNGAGNHACARVFNSVYKAYPEDGPIELAVDSLCRRIFFGESFTAWSDFLNIKYKGQDIPYLMTGYLDGVDLITWLTLGKDLFKQINSQFNLYRMAMIVVISFLLNFEDAKPDNFHVRKRLRQVLNELLVEFYLSSPDNDHIAPFSVTIDKDGHRKLESTNIVLCMQHMLQAMPGEMRQMLERVDIYKVLGEWFTELDVLTSFFDRMYTAKKQDELKATKKVTSTYLFAPGSTTVMVEKFKGIQRMVATSPLATMNRVFEEIDPSAFAAYDAVRRRAQNNGDDPNADFNEIGGKKYSTLTAGNSKVVVRYQTTHMVADTVGADYSPKQALAELRGIVSQDQAVKEASEALQAGNIEPFKKLISDSLRQKVLDKTVPDPADPAKLIPILSKVNKQTLEQLFAFLQKSAVAVRRLNLNGNTQVTTNMLLEFLKNNMQHLQKLDLRGCSQLEVDKLIPLLEKYNPESKKHESPLEKLYLGELPNLTKIAGKDGPLNLPRLTCLLIEDCDVTIIRLRAPLLKSLILTCNEKLIEIELHGNQVSHLALDGCPNLPRKQEERLFAQSPRLLRNQLEFKSNHELYSLAWPWFCKMAGVDAWTKENVAGMSAKGQLSLQGIAVSSIEFSKIIEYLKQSNGSKLRKLDLRYSTAMTAQNFALIIRELVNLDGIRYAKMYPSRDKEAEPDNLQPEATKIEAMVFGPNGELFIATSNVIKERSSVNSSETDGVYKGHTNPIKSLIVLPDGLASGSLDNTISIWDRATRTSRMVLKGHTNPVLALLYFDGILVSASRGMIKFWNLSTGECTKTSNPEAHDIFALAEISRELLVSGNDNGSLQYWHKNGTLIDTVRTGTKATTVIKRLSETSFITAHRDGYIHVWDSVTRQKKLTINAHAGQPIYGVEVLIEGQLIATASEDRTVKIWDLLANRCLQTMILSGPVTSLALSPEGLVIAFDKGLAKRRFHESTLSLSAFRADSIATVIQRGDKTIKFTRTDIDEATKNIFPECRTIIESILGDQGFTITISEDKKELLITNICPEKYSLLDSLLSAIKHYLACGHNQSPKQVSSIVKSVRKPGDDLPPPAPKMVLVDNNSSGSSRAIAKPEVKAEVRNDVRVNEAKPVVAATVLVPAPVTVAPASVNSQNTWRVAAKGGGARDLSLMAMRSSNGVPQPPVPEPQRTSNGSAHMGNGDSVLQKGIVAVAVAPAAAQAQGSPARRELAVVTVARDAVTNLRDSSDDSIQASTLGSGKAGFFASHQNDSPGRPRRFPQAPPPPVPTSSDVNSSGTGSSGSGSSPPHPVTAEEPVATVASSSRAIPSVGGTTVPRQRFVPARPKGGKLDSAALATMMQPDQADTTTQRAVFPVRP